MTSAWRSYQHWVNPAFHSLPRFRLVRVEFRGISALRTIKARVAIPRVPASKIPTPRSLTSLKKVINNLDELPYCTGTVPLNANTASLFYQSTDQSRAEKLDFTKITDEQLGNLARACDPGLTQRDVLDESYRRAGKLDANRFATHFSPTDSGILEIVSDLLLRGRVPEKSIRLELYKLNIYGPGGFFKTHVDTPRSDTMFGSLVVVLPTVHEGGSLIIRHNRKEWTFDSSKAVNTESTPHAPFVALFSDVEHEVTPVSSGYRTTLTYNLYLKNKSQENAATVAGFGQTDMKIKNALKRLMKDTNFLPDGGILGFGFDHKYPFDRDTTNFPDLDGCLKGTDASIKRACDSLSLTSAIKVVYRENDEDDAVLLDHFAYLGRDEIEWVMVEYLKEKAGGLVIYEPHSNYGRRSSDSELVDAAPIIWVKPLEETNRFSTPYVHYGNEATLGCVYGEICLVLMVPPAHERVSHFLLTDRADEMPAGSQNK